MAIPAWETVLKQHGAGCLTVQLMVFGHIGLLGAVVHRRVTWLIKPAPEPAVILLLVMVGNHALEIILKLNGVSFLIVQASKKTTFISNLSCYDFNVAYHSPLV